MLLVLIISEYKVPERHTYHHSVSQRHQERNRVIKLQLFNLNIMNTASGCIPVPVFGVNEVAHIFTEWELSQFRKRDFSA